MVNLDDYYSAGYFLLRNFERDPKFEDGLLPSRIVSLTSCGCPISRCSLLKLYWGWKNEPVPPLPSGVEEALTFGIPPALMDAFSAWSSQALNEEAGYPGAFYTVADARRFVERFLPDRTNLYLIGGGLHREIAAGEWCRPNDLDTYIASRITQKIPLEASGQPLGYEVADFCYNDFCDSWLCTQAHQDAFEIFGIRPNAYGLIDTYEDAKKVYEWIETPDEDGRRRGEPEPYTPWLVVSYPL